MTESLSSSYPSASVGIGVSSGYPVRHALAEALRAASRALARMASHLSVAEVRSENAALASTAASDGISPLVEFYAEAGAAEGALYADGKLLGYLPVARL